MSETPGYQRLFAELKRRKVFKVAAVYGAVSFGVLQVADILVPAMELPDSFVRGIALVCLLGFPIALVLAWAFETGPEGVQRTSEPEPGEITQIVSAPRGRRWPSGILALAGTAALIVGGWLALSSRSGASDSVDAAAPVAAPPGGDETARADERTSIAVLPFRNTSGDPEAQAFTDGVHDDLLNQLSKISSLKVITRTSVEEYRGTTKSMPEIGRELGVDNILEGGVQSAGGAFRINAQLIDAESEGNLWAEQYEGELSVANIFQVQSEIADEITEALRAQLTESERAAIARTPTDDFDAYQDYLQARAYFLESYLESNFRSADAIVSRVLERDPEFAEAWALKGAVGSMLYHFHFERSDSLVAASRESIERALELEPGLPEGHAALGHWYYRTQLDYPRALRELEIAIEARPSDAGFETTIASVYRRAGDMEKALDHFERGVDLDPRSAMAPYSVGETLALLRRYDEAKVWVRRAMDIRPDFNYPYVYLSMFSIRADGDTAGARLWLQRMNERGLVADEGEFNVVDLDLLVVRPESENLDETRERVLESVRGLGGTLDHQFRYVPRSLLSGLVRRQMGDPAGAAAAFDSARSELSAMVAQHPDGSRYRSSLGLALAGLGLEEEAVREGREGLRLMPPEVEAWRGGRRLIDLARIYAMTGRTDDAIDQLERIMSMPADLSAWDLRLDPMWDPLRGDPRFEALAAAD
ncbi:MAG: tetratricopeptide repeat protein [Gemmatimonadetes bacterium]|nr:tetratricopeptide repeat protein [Gemmatimonadota bacterium]